MPDTLSQSQRSHCMSSIRGKNTKPEILVRKGLHARGFRFRLHNKKLPGSPDVVLPKYGVVTLHCYGYNKYGVMVSNDVEGMELSCDPATGYVNEKGVFTEEELTKIYFAFDAVCFYKSYYGYLMSLTYDDTQRKKTHEKLIEYAYYIDEVSGPFFEAVYADEYHPLKMTNDEFEVFMLKATEIKVDIMRLLTEQFHLIAKEQKNTSAE